MEEIQEEEMKADDLLLYICWLLDVQEKNQFETPVEANEKEQHIVDIYMLYILLLKKKEKASKRKFWVRPIFSLEQRILQGASDNLVIECAFRDRMKYLEYLRMNERSFNKLLSKIRPHIQKQNAVRDSIPPYTRLHICLRYLASGDSMQSISYAFRVGSNTVCKIIRETCSAIWKVLRAECFPELTSQRWRDHAREFENIWNFRHCIGAVDRKLVVMQAPKNSGSAYYTYKKTFAINLMAVVDAHYRFIAVDIGAPGRRSDGGVFRESAIGVRLESNSMNVPQPDSLEENGPLMPYVLVADEAFTLTTYLMRPYPRAGELSRRDKIFNYRLSRARRVVENAFGILGARWRIFRSPLTTSVKTTKKIVQATTCLHNWIISENLKNATNKQHDISYSNLSPSEMSLAVCGLQSFNRRNETNAYVDIDENPIRIRN